MISAPGPAVPKTATVQRTIDCEPMDIGVKVNVRAIPVYFRMQGSACNRGTNTEPSACEVRWPVPFLAAIISLLLLPGTHLLLGEQ